MNPSQKRHAIVSESSYAHRSRIWDVVVTAAIVIVLLLPVPFVRFTAWPSSDLVLARPVLPWSAFALCYWPPNDNSPVMESYHLNWYGELAPAGTPFPHPAALISMNPPLLRWQKDPAQPLEDLWQRGLFLEMHVLWRPMLYWPLVMAVDAFHHYSRDFNGKGSR